MSGPHGGEAPPSILIAWSSQRNAWTATAVLDLELPAEPVSGPSTSTAATPAAALQELLTRRFCVVSDRDCPATLVTIVPAEEPER